jgi:hypothetical protein
MISAQEYELLSFFEVAPSVMDEDVPWPYNDFLYEVEKDDFTISCTIAPSYKDVKLSLRHHDKFVYEFAAMHIEDIKILNDEGKETLELIIRPSHRIFINIKPHIEIREDLTTDT